MTKLERLVRNSGPVTFVTRKSKFISLPGFQGIPLYDIVIFLSEQFKKTSLTSRAKSIAYDFAMAIPAVLICIFTIIPYLPIAKQFTKELLQLTRAITPNQNSYNIVNGFLNDFLNTPRVGLLSFGFVLVIFYASNAMLSIIKTFDISIYSQRRKMNFVKKRIKAIRLTVVVLLIIVATIILLIGQGLIFEYLIQWLHLKKSHVFWIAALKWILTILLFFYSIAFIYKYAPSVRKRWRTISPGSVIATLLMIATTSGFSYWVNHFNNFNKIYGSLGSILIFMILIYLNSFILLFGFELNLSISILKSEAAERRRIHLESEKLKTN